eukprot:7460213-Karenia_brevis.AAC.1
MMCIHPCAASKFLALYTDGSGGSLGKRKRLDSEGQAVCKKAKVCKDIVKRRRTCGAFASSSVDT